MADANISFYYSGGKLRGCEVLILRALYLDVINFHFTRLSLNFDIKK